MAVYVLLEDGHAPERFFANRTLEDVAIQYNHDCSQVISVRMLDGGYVNVSLDMKLSDLKGPSTAGDGSKDNPFIVRVKDAGARAAWSPEDVSPQMLAWLRKELRMEDPAAPLRATRSFAASYENRAPKRLKLELPGAPSTAEAGAPSTGEAGAPSTAEGGASGILRVPPCPAARIRVAEQDEDGELLPRMLDILRNLPGAKRLPHPVNGRDAVSYNDMVIVDTHTLAYLGGGAGPDLTLMADGYSVSSGVVYALLELQVGNIDSAHKGKMESYLIALLAATPSRRFAKGAVFNGADVVFFEARRNGDDEVHVFESCWFTMATGTVASQAVWKIFWTFLLSGGKHLPSGSPQEHYGWAPPQLSATFIGTGHDNLHSSPAPLQLLSLIASNARVSVWLVKLPRSQAVCKHFQQRHSSFTCELTALQAVNTPHKPAAQEDLQGRQLWPRLLAVGHEQRVLVTEPHVAALEGPEGVLTYARLCELLAGFRYLHKVVGYVYRDLEDKHVGMADGRLCVFDLSTCVPLNDGSSTRVGYAGTIINASDDVLDALSVGGSMQVPARVQQDLVALVKTVYALTHRARLPVIQALASEVAAELLTGALTAGGKVAQRVRTFWSCELSDRTPAGKRWQALVLAAHLDAWSPDGTSASVPDDYDRVVAELHKLAELVCPG